MQNSCPSCGKGSEFIAYGVVAPWILILWGRELKEPIRTTLEYCNSCKLKFFSYRYNSKEASDLYQDYRNEIWFHIRHSFEPWYGRGTNNAYIGPDAHDKIAVRRKFTEDLLLNSGIDIHNLGDYLDFGGDSGQFFPEGVKGRKILFDLQSPQLDGIETISSLSELQSKVKTVSNCYVLEHVSDINLNLREMGGCLEDEGYILIELPFDDFRTHSFHKTDSYLWYLDFIFAHKFLFIVMDFFSGLYRQFFNKIPLFGVIKQSEHINYFTPQALIKCVENNGFKVVYNTTPERKNYVGLIKQGRFGLVAQMNRTA
jgi:hypothetical protein